MLKAGLGTVYEFLKDFWPLHPNGLDEPLFSDQGLEFIVVCMCFESNFCDLDHFCRLQTPISQPMGGSCGLFRMW